MGQKPLQKCPSNIPSPPTSACQSSRGAPPRSIQQHESQWASGY